MNTTTITRFAAFALTFVGAGLAVTSVTSPAQASDDWMAQMQCASVGGTYHSQVDRHDMQTISWSCTYSVRGTIPEQIDLPPLELSSACQGTSSFVSDLPTDVFSCVL